MGKIECTITELKNLYVQEFNESDTELVEIYNDIIDKVSDALTSNKKSFTYQLKYYYSVNPSDLKLFLYPLYAVGFVATIDTEEIRTTFYDTEPFYILKVTL